MDKKYLAVVGMGAAMTAVGAALLIKHAKEAKKRNGIYFNLNVGHK
jgi:hypothetical protein